MNQKSSLRKILQFVSHALTANRPVRANWIRKSIGAENTFSTDLNERHDMVAQLKSLIDKVWRHCESAGTRGRTVTLKVKFADFEIITRS